MTKLFKGGNYFQKYGIYLLWITYCQQCYFCLLTNFASQISQISQTWLFHTAILHVFYPFLFPVIQLSKMLQYFLQQVFNSWIFSWYHIIYFLDFCHFKFVFRTSWIYQQLCLRSPREQKRTQNLWTCCVYLSQIIWPFPNHT